MKKIVCIVLLALSCLCMQGVMAQHKAATSAQKPTLSISNVQQQPLPQAKKAFPPIEFVENKGQWPEEVLFRGEVGNGYVFLTRTGITVLQHNQEDITKIYSAVHGDDTPPVDPISGEVTQPSGVSQNARMNNLKLRSHTYKVKLVNSTIASSKVIGEKPQESIVNYIYGDDPSQWGTNCQTYLAVTYKDVYENIDMRFYSDGGLLKYDFIAKPGSRVKDIALDYEGLDKIAVKKNQLHLQTSVGAFKELYPYTYQSGGTQRKEVSCKYRLKGKNRVAFDVGDYDTSATLIIDPSLVFSSFSGSLSDNWGFTATYGPDGSFYGGGIVFGNGFPTSPGAFQQNFNGNNNGFDMSIIKLDPLGRDRIYATYIGGSGNEQPHSLVVDNQGNLIIAGRTNSENFPAKGPENIKGSKWDIVLVKLNAAGTGLIGTARIGGSGNDGVNITDSRSGPNSLHINYGDDARSEVIIDDAGNIYLASCTNSSDLVFKGNTLQAAKSGNQDGVLLKFTPDLSQMLFGTYLGGSGDDAAYVLALAPNGDIYVAGGTKSADFPGNKTGTVGSSYNGGTDGINGFIAIVSNDGKTLIRSTYIRSTNGNTIEQVYGIQFDKVGFPYIMGTTTGSWLVKNAAFVNNGAKQFVGKLDPNLQGYIFSTTFGTNSRSPNISPTAFMVDRCENLYISGWGGNIGSYKLAGTNGMYVSDFAYQKNTDNADLYFIVIKKNAESVLYATFFGQQGGLTEHVDGGTSRFDPNGNIFQTICANCSSSKDPSAVGPRPKFPTSPDAWRTGNPSESCNMGLLKFRFDYTGVSAILKSRIDGVPGTKGCIPLTVDLYDSIRSAKSYKWVVEEGAKITEITTTDYRLPYTFTTVGQHKVTLTAYDPESCNGEDSSVLIITAGDNKANLAFRPEKVKPNDCNDLTYMFINESDYSATAKPFSDKAFTWELGQGGIIGPVGVDNKPAITYTAGTYNVKLNLIDPDYCNSPTSLTKIVRVASNVKAVFNTPAKGCAPYDAVFTNDSEGGTEFEWDFGDGTIIIDHTGGTMTHSYASAGDYVVTMTARDENTCNKENTSQPFLLKVFDKPTADFTFQPVVPIENTPVDFFNSSSTDVIKFLWQFGDGESETTTNPHATISHLYNKTGEYPVKLIVENSAGCTNDIEKKVPALIFPLLDVPSAFTPQKGGINGIIKVNGFGIGKLLFRIYNRWGQLVFESNSLKNGWDGTFKGALQPMDVYSYIVEAEFTDGTKTSRRGDITLIR